MLGVGHSGAGKIFKRNHPQAKNLKMGGHPVKKTFLPMESQSPNRPISSPSLSIDRPDAIFLEFTLSEEFH
jgi:hypothetical protein